MAVDPDASYLVFPGEWADVDGLQWQTTTRTSKVLRKDKVEHRDYVITVEHEGRSKDVCSAQSG